jgi:alcohol oxidase
MHTCMLLTTSYFSGKKAVGVEYVSSDKELTGPKTQAYASKLVIVSAGAFGSPAILERSGIGSKDILGKVGVQEAVVDLPGVGENYHGGTVASLGCLLAD